MPYVVTPTHIDLIRPGDTVLVDGLARIHSMPGRTG